MQIKRTVHKCEPCDKKNCLLSNEPREKLYEVSDQVRHISGFTTTEDGWRLGISDLATTKALISCKVTAQLICAFVFAYICKKQVSHIMTRLKCEQYRHRSAFAGRLLPGRKP